MHGDRGAHVVQLFHNNGRASWSDIKMTLCTRGMVVMICSQSYPTLWKCPPSGLKWVQEYHSVSKMGTMVWLQFGFCTRGTHVPYHVAGIPRVNCSGAIHYFYSHFPFPPFFWYCNALCCGNFGILNHKYHYYFLILAVQLFTLYWSYFQVPMIFHFPWSHDCGKSHDT